MPKSKLNSMVRLIDSTTIDLNISQFKWANFRSKKAGIKLHTVYDPSVEIPVYFEMTHAKVNDRKALTNLPVLKGMTYVVDRAYNHYSCYHTLTEQRSSFIGRMKKNAFYEGVEFRDMSAKKIVYDEVIRFTSNKARKDCPTLLWRMTFRRPEDQKILVFISNDCLLAD